jgi:dTDP-D-glucose 4,6-dehydratase
MRRAIENITVACTDNHGSYTYKGKAVPLHAMEALGGEEV